MLLNADWSEHKQLGTFMGTMTNVRMQVGTPANAGTRTSGNDTPSIIWGNQPLGNLSRLPTNIYQIDLSY